MLPDALDQADQGLSFFMVGLKMEHRQGSVEPCIDYTMRRPTRTMVLHHFEPNHTRGGICA